MLYASLAGVAARLLLAFSGLGRDVLAWRVEVATAANSPLELREGFALYRLGVSPYSGSSCRTPPLALWLYGAAHGPASGVQDAGAELMHALPNIALDLLTATLLSRVAKQLFSPGRKQAGSPGAGATGAGSAASVLPSLVAWVYLLNPFTLMSAAAGTTSPLEAAGVAAALYGAVVVAAASRGRGLALAALGLAVATHAALHCAVLLLPLACLLAVGPEDVATPLRRLCLRTSLSGAAAGARALGTSGGLAPGLAGEVGQEADAAGDADTDRERQEAAWLSSLPTDEHLARRQAGVEEKGEGQVERRLGRPGLARLKLPNTPTTPITPGGREFPPPSAGGGGGAAAGGAAAGGGKRAKAEFDALTRWLRQPLLPWRQLAQCGGLALVFWLLLAALADVYLLPVSAPATGGGGGDAAQPPAACALAIAGPLFLQPPAPGSEAGAAAESLVLRLGPLELPVSLPPPAAAALAAARARLAAAGAAAAGCWAGRVYGGQVLLDDVSPNVGQWWYLAMEAFDDAKPYVRLLAHSLLFALAPPLALRLGTRRPLALFVVQLLALGLLRPYPSVADLGLAAALLPLLSRQQGAALQLGLLLPAGLLLLGVLGPAMCAMWLQHESANSNFLYSITLLYGAWQVLLLGQVLGLTLHVDRIARGKETLEPATQQQQQAAEEGPVAAAAHAS
ncbi:hypothetical protein CHLRE_03g150400v5 [Chlamydomonas reinhardtii]|uniref:GPI transamidase subunit PIG-U n=1 Tax=Chlamydomonas reinhardtii TaxID=3055 RepID=A8J2P8_CHLRE|nr:uncharacterized protein CHLRE_03g150400v5 [Chlamydomonas reinhardtii]PNW84591.1 hypothetical protein CHLRE_03g150400v5 [Chlamydomonas reinhardtii]|eukprot:XP_001695559.1 predicted protein [Chlamydomonas reinhardtii]